MFRRAVERAGGTVEIVEKYQPAANGMLGPAMRVVEAIKRGEEEMTPVDALFLPGGRDALPRIGPVIAYSGLDTRKVKLLGTGAWDFPSVGRDEARRRLVSQPRSGQVAHLCGALRQGLRQCATAHRQHYL